METPNAIEYLRYGVDDQRIPPHPTTVIENVHVFDGYAFGAPERVYIADGKIVDPKHVKKVEKYVQGDGQYLLPGLIDCHAHPTTLADLEALRDHGVTTVMELGNGAPAQIAGLKHHVGLPDLFTAGVFGTGPGGTHARLLGACGLADELVDSPDAAVRFVARRLAAGVDHVKAIADVPGMDQETLNVLVAQATQNDQLSMVHAASHTPYRMAMRARPSVIHHVPLDKPLSIDEDNDLLAHHQFAAVPTLVTMKAHAEMRQPARPQSAADQYERAAAMSTRVLRAAGVPILAGSDAVLFEKVPVQVAFGVSLHQELHLLVRAGLTAIEAVRAATTLPPRYFRLPDRGFIKPGLRADMVLVRGNPLDDIAAIELVERVWLKGVEHEPRRK